MRLIFLYMSYGPAPEGSNQPWDFRNESHNRFVHDEGLPTEGYFHMLKRLWQKGIIDELVIFIESNRSPGKKTIDGIECYVVPEIKYVEDFLEEGDVIFARGGFRTWYNFLTRMQIKGHWLMLYAANTGRARWKFWDVVFDDIQGKHWWDTKQRFFHDFKKPINPIIFKPMKTLRDYDVCIGASNVHDKKAQWKTIDALIDLELQDRLDRPLLRRKYVMPGAIKRGVNTNHILKKIRESGMNVHTPGHVHRSKLNEYYNRSKLFVYLGNSGQNDRGPLEAMSVGCPILLGGVTRHSPVLHKNTVGCKIATDPNNPAVTAGEMREMIDLHTEGLRVHNQIYFDNVSGMETVIIPDMAKLFGLIRANLNRKEKVEVLKVAYGLADAPRTKGMV